MSNKGTRKCKDPEAELCLVYSRDKESPAESLLDSKSQYMELFLQL
jgi:hypothetical protein